MHPSTEEKGRRCRQAILVLQNMTLDSVFRQIFADDGHSDEELMSSIDYLYGTIGKLHCLCQKHKNNYCFCKDLPLVVHSFKYTLKEEYLTTAKRHQKRPRMVNKRANPEDRKRTKCQLCPLSVVHMLRHLMNTHGLSRQEAKQAKVPEGQA